MHDRRLLMYTGSRLLVCRENTVDPKAFMLVGNKWSEIQHGSHGFPHLLGLQP